MFLATAFEYCFKLATVLFNERSALDELELPAPIRWVAALTAVRMALKASLGSFIVSAVRIMNELTFKTAFADMSDNSSDDWVASTIAAIQLVMASVLGYSVVVMSMMFWIMSYLTACLMEKSDTLTSQLLLPRYSASQAH